MFIRICVEGGTVWTGGLKDKATAATIISFVGQFWQRNERSKLLFLYGSI